MNIVAIPIGIILAAGSALMWHYWQLNLAVAGVLCIVGLEFVIEGLGIRFSNNGLIGIISRLLGMIRGTTKK